MIKGVGVTCVVVGLRAAASTVAVFGDLMIKGVGVTCVVVGLRVASTVVVFSGLTCVIKGAGVTCVVVGLRVASTGSGADQFQATAFVSTFL